MAFMHYGEGRDGSPYSCSTFGISLVVGFLTTRLEDDSGWSTGDAAFAFSLMGLAMIFGGPIFAAFASE